MNEEKIISTEFFEDNSSKNKEEHTGPGRDTMRRLIIGTFVVMCSIPVLFCLYLMIRMNGVEKRLEKSSYDISMKDKLSVVAEYTESTTEDMGDVLALEHEAYADLGKAELDEGEDIILSDSNQSSATYNQVNSTVELSGSFKVSDSNEVYLTFDDGPSIYTDEILDILKKNNVKATFFVVYTDKEELWPMYRRIVEEGHTLAMHSYSHVYEDIYASQEAFQQDVTMIHDFLLEQTGVDCTYYRFPGGSSNQVSGVDIQDLMGYLYDNGITYYDWNSLSGDAVDMSLTSEELNANVMEYVRSNEGASMVLLHDLENNPATMEGLQALIDTLKEEGYEICPIDDDTTPVQHVTYQED